MVRFVVALAYAVLKQPCVTNGAKVDPLLKVFVKTCVAICGVLYPDSTIPEGAVGEEYTLPNTSSGRQGQDNTVIAGLAQGMGSLNSEALEAQLREIRDARIAAPSSASTPQ